MIKNLLFDLGGVIMDLDRNRCVDAFKGLGMKDPDDFLGLYGQKGDFLALESGEIGADEFHRRIRPLFGNPDLTDAQIDDAFNQFLIGIPVDRLEALRALRSDYRICLLSNTNPIMMESKIAEEFCKEGREMADYFDGIVTSFNIGVCKPDPAIFRAVTDKFGIIPSETIFLDDSAENCRIGAELGFSPLHVPAESSFMPILEKADL